MHIKMGDDGRYSVIEIGIVTFHKESNSHIRLKDVMFFLYIKKNLVFITVLEDHGYDVIFRKGKAFLRHIARG